MKEWAGHGGEEVCVFMGVEVGDIDSGALELLKLSEGFALDVIFADVAAKKRLSEVNNAGAEGLAVGAEESRDALGVSHWNPVNQADVAANAKARIGMSDGNSVFKGGAICHERGGGEGAGLVKLGYSAIDAKGQSKVVGVEDEAERHVCQECIEFG